MANRIELTPFQPVQATAATTKQAVYDAVEVLGYDAMDFQLGVVQYATFTNATFTIETSMQNELDDESWKTVATFTAVTTAPTYEIKSVDKGFLRYVRWKVVTTGGAGSLHFWIRGIGRRYA